jgi:hypothetical protein
MDGKSHSGVMVMIGGVGVFFALWSQNALVRV